VDSEAVRRRWDGDQKSSQRMQSEVRKGNNHVPKSALKKRVTLETADGHLEEPGSHEQPVYHEDPALPSRAPKVKQEADAEIERLSLENRALRVELGQTVFKVRQLTKLREQALQAQREGLQAKASERRAVKELDEAKDYVQKSLEFARSEKTELLLRIKALEKAASDVTGREDELRADLQGTISDAALSFERVDNARREMERWKKQAVDENEKLKKAEQRLKQLEQKRSDDKQKIQQLASQLQATIDEKVAATGKALWSDEIKKPLPDAKRAASPSPTATRANGARRGGSQPPQGGRRERQQARAVDPDLKYLEVSRLARFGESVWTTTSGVAGTVASGARGVVALCRTARDVIQGNERDERDSGTRKKGGKGRRRGEAQKLPFSADSAACISAAEGAEDDGDTTKQQIFLGALLVFIVGMAAAKLCS